MIESIHIVHKLNSEDDSYVQLVSDIVQDAAHSMGCTRVYSFADITPDTLVIAIGGDGTMLHAMNIASRYNTVVMGINLGKIGFLTDFIVNESLFDNVQHIIKHCDLDDSNFEERISIRGTYRLNEKTTLSYAAFNEFVISNEYSDNIITYDLIIGDMHAGEHKATSLIISAPTGSTAYSLSAGGALVLPNMEVVQIIPVAPLSMSSRPIIVPSNMTIKVKFKSNGTICIKADGQTMERIDSVGEISFRNNDVKTRVLHSDDYNFFNMLTKKLGWKQN